MGYKETVLFVNFFGNFPDLLSDGFFFENMGNNYVAWLPVFTFYTELAQYLSARIFKNKGKSYLEWA